MSEPTEQTRGFYFDDDIGMAARAMIEMFGDDVVKRVSERLSEIRAEGGEDRTLFWETLLDEIVKQRSS